MPTLHVWLRRRNFDLLYFQGSVMMKIKFAGMALLLLIPGLMAGCGGGGSSTPAPSTLSGIAAVGSPIVGGNVAVKCASGSPPPTPPRSTRADSATPPPETPPCAGEG